MCRYPLVLLVITFVISQQATSGAALVTNSPATITSVLTVNPIIVRDDAGGNPANFMGTQESEIKSLVDAIWAQAGIDIQWLAPMSLNSTETLDGSQGPNGNNPRPSNDLSGDAGGIDHETIGQNAGVRLANTVNMFFVNIPAGFGALATNASAGLAEQPGDDISMYVGSELLTFGTLGSELIASVIAHEIGHNLSLPHLDVAEGLMRPGGSATMAGQRLSAAEVNAAIMSGTTNGILTAVPEPNPMLLLAFIGLIGRGATSLRKQLTQDAGETSQ